jgi:hypothetical protein
MTSCIKDDSALSRVSCRPATADDVPACFAIESASYPSDEGALLEALTCRQAEALPHFQRAALQLEDDNDDTRTSETIIGFCCSTRCDELEEESMSTHAPTGPLLVVHSVVAQEERRRRGVCFVCGIQGQS